LVWRAANRSFRDASRHVGKVEERAAIQSGHRAFFEPQIGWRNASAAFDIGGGGDDVAVTLDGGARIERFLDFAVHEHVALK